MVTASSVAGRLIAVVGFALRYVVFWILERVLPTRANHWAFCTWHGTYAHTLDNPRGLFEEVKNDPDIVKIILTKPRQDPNSTVIEGKNVVVVDVETLRGALWLARSRFLIIGFGIGGVCSYSNLISAKHQIIQLWHGIPLKRIGRLFAGEPHWQIETPRYTATVCSSDSDREIMAAAFAPIPKSNVWLSGLPRNDLILKDEKALPADYRRDLARLRGQIGGRRFVLYAPTWRAAEVGIYAFSDEERHALEALLAKHDAVLGIRAHANRRMQSEHVEGKQPQIFYVNDYPDVNVMLRITDVLITDYSSIYIDFLLTGRPILHFAYDVDRYVGERGFLYELSDAMSDQWFTSFADLLKYLDVALSGGGISEPRYSAARKLFHGHANEASRDVAQRLRALAAAR
jgi:CDP-glycerol glycerophosphotransferase (TagB/SpsB family)